MAGVVFIFKCQCLYLHVHWIALSPFVCEELHLTGHRHSIRPTRSDYGLQTGLLHTLCEHVARCPPPHVSEKLFDELLAVPEEDILGDTFQQKEYLH